MRIAAVLVAVGVLAGAGQALAHHSIAAMYDREKTVDLQGRIVSVQLINPHSLFEVEVRGADGKMATWTVESRGAGGMQRTGIDTTLIAVGDQVKMTGNPIRTGANAMWLSKLEAKGQTFDMTFRR